MSNLHREHKEQLYTLFAKIAGAMANPHRLELLDLLAQAPRTVEQLSNEAHMSVANTSQHLQRLKQMRLVASEREGLYMRYWLADAAVANLWMELRRVAELQLAEVEQALDVYRARRHEFEKISAGELAKRMQSGEVILLDVRPTIEYDTGHLPGAVSVPIDDFAQQIDTLPDDLPVVAYCRGRYCVYADDALAQLAEQGRAVSRLDEGVLEWQEQGYQLDSES